MADLKISALTASTTPLAGTEVLPIVQSSTTKQVSVSNLTAGRAVSALSFTSTTDATFATSSGSVGVGTSSPSYKLDVRSSAGNIASWSDGTTPGTLYSGGGYVGLTFPATTGGFFINTAGNFNTISTNGAERVRVDSSGNTSLATGNLVIGTSGKGIDFSATPGTGTSELLADYEEGLCTLGIAFGGGTTGITYGGRPISYVKVGSLVTVVGYIGLSNKGSSTGSATITGLPFTTASSANGGFAAVTLSAANLSFVGQYSGYTAASGTTVNLYQTAATGTLSALTDANFANNTEIEFCIHYRSV